MLHKRRELCHQRGLQVLGALNPCLPCRSCSLQCLIFSRAPFATGITVISKLGVRQSSSHEVFQECTGIVHGYLASPCGGASTIKTNNKHKMGASTFH